VRQSLERELGVSLEDHQWIQATLLVSMGGLGLRRVETHSPGAYIASLGASSDIMEEIVGRKVEMETKVVRLVDLINSLSGEGELTPEGALASTQQVISHTLDQHQVKLLQEVLTDERDKARVNSVGMLRAGDWLNAAPVRALGLHLRPKEFTAAVKYRLGIPVYPSADPCIACGEDSDKFGDHAIGCGKEGERIYRHNVIRDAIYETAKQASLAPAKEQSALLPGSQAKPADVYIPGWANGRDAALDVTVVSSLQKELKKRAAAEVGSAAVRRHSDKMTKYFRDCDREGIQFFPIVVEALGGWHSDAAAAVSKLARQLASHTGREEEETTRYLFQRLSLLLMRGNAALILNRTPFHVSAEVDGDQDFDT
jgi:hypothetical protein